MAKLKSISFQVRCADGTDYRFVGDCVVNADGLFHVAYPPEVESSINSLICSANDFGQDCKLTSSERTMFGRIHLETLKVNKRAYGPVLAEIEQLITKAMELHMQCEVRRELVILYSTDYAYALAKGSDGGLGANGGHVKGYEWTGNLHATNGSSHYRVGLAAFVRIKLSYIRPTGTKTQYEDLNRGSGRWGETLEEHPKPAERLNDFVGLRFHDPYAKWRGESVKYTEIPYSDEAAVFFYDALLAVASLADRLQAFFGDRDTVARAIAGHGSMPGLLTGPAA